MNEQLMMMGFGLSLPEKIDKAIATLRHYEAEALKQNPVDGYWLADSYGKDSCVILELAKMSGVRFRARHNLTTIDPPELIRFGRKHHPDTEIKRPKMPFFTRLANSNQMLPTRLQRWCCAEYKESTHGGDIAVFGIRAQESARRKANWRVWTPYRGGTWVLNPILYWTDENVWQFIRDRNLPYCSLYDEGFTRLGCIGCPMGGKQRQRQFARWPGYERAWKRASAAMFNRLKGTPTVHGKRRSLDDYADAEAYWQWWMNDEPKPDEKDECQMGLF